MTLADRFHAAMARAAGARVLCVGDLMLDRYVYGDVKRISPEGPVPVFHHQRQAERLGGAGNVCKNLVALGVTPHLVAAVGSDSEGDTLHDILAPTLPSTLIRRTDAPTTIKTRYIARAQQVLRIDREQSRALDANGAAALLDAARSELAGAAMLILSDYAKGVLLGDIARQLIATAAEVGLRTVIDPKSQDFSRYRGAFLVTPNLSELQQAAGRELTDDDAIAAAARELCNANDIVHIAVTMSENGILIVGPEGDLRRPARKSDVYDVTGAGDAVLAALSACLIGDMALDDAAEVAMASASIAVTRTGAVSVPVTEIEQALRDWSAKHDPRVIRDWTVLAEKVDRWRDAGETVGFTNGVFDLLHPGHLSLLEQAAAHCTKLIVALNSDASVKRLKGRDRPIQPEDVRARVVSAIEGVAAVTVFDQDTPLELITLLRPDLLVKGSDYTLDQVVGADVVREGGTVLLVDLVSGHSTTRTVSRIRNTE